MAKIAARQIKTAGPSAVGAVNNPGSSDSLSNADHVHAHGSHADPTAHEAASPTAAGFMSSGDKADHDAAVAKLAGIPANADNTASFLGTANFTYIGLGTKRLVNMSDPVDAQDAATKNYVDATAAAASATPLSSSTPAAIGTPSPGSSDKASKADHVHAHGDQAGGSLHAEATSGAAGFMSTSHVTDLAAAKTKLAGIADGADVTPAFLSNVNFAIMGMGTKRLANLSNPVDPQDGATKSYVDSAASAAGVRFTVFAVQRTTHQPLTAGAMPMAIDPYLTDIDIAGGFDGEYILLTAQSPATQNGVYLAVDSADAGTWVRPAGANTSQDFHKSWLVFSRGSSSYTPAELWCYRPNQPATNFTLGTHPPLFMKSDTTDYAISKRTTSLSLNNQKIVSLGTPTASADAANKSYVDAAVAAKPHGNQTSGGSMHQAATVSTNGFMSTTQVADLTAAKSKTDSLVAGQTASVGTLNLAGSLNIVPQTITWGNTVVISPWNCNDYILQLAGSGGTTIHFNFTGFSGAQHGRQGSIWVRQDATGNRTLDIVIDDANSQVMKDAGLLDLNPQPAANSWTLYGYYVLLVGGITYVFISKASLVNK